MKIYVIQYIDRTYAGTLKGDFIRTEKLEFATQFITKGMAKEFVKNYAPMSKGLPYSIIEV